MNKHFFLKKPYGFCRRNFTDYKWHSNSNPINSREPDIHLEETWSLQHCKSLSIWSRLVQCFHSSQVWAATGLPIRSWHITQLLGGHMLCYVLSVEYGCIRFAWMWLQPFLLLNWSTGKKASSKLETPRWIPVFFVSLPDWPVGLRKFPGKS